MKTALVTGGLGFIGSNLVKILLEKKIVTRCVLLDSFDATIVGGFRETVLPRFRQLRADLIALEDIM